MKNLDLIILRHGEAGTRIPIPNEDSERALTEKGKTEVEEVAKSLRRMKLKVSCIATSPLMRSLETAKIVAAGLKKKEELELWDELKPEGQRNALYERLSKLKEESVVLIVGHEPLLSSLIGDLVSGRPSSRISLKKAGVARVRVNTLKPKASGIMKWLLTPKQILKMQ